MTGERSGQGESPIREHGLEVIRTARYATLGSVEGRPRELWLLCHGYRQLARRFLRRFRRIRDPGRLLVAPEGLSRFYLDPADRRHGPRDRVGASWMTREDRLAEIRDYVRYLDALLDHVCHRLEALPERTVVLGFSQGVHTASRWVVRGGARPPDELILWGAYLPPDLEMTRAASRLEGVRLILVRGEADRHADPGRREAELERLERWGIAYREISFPGGHEVDEDVLDRLAAGG